MTQMEKNAVDRYITERLPGGLTPREQAVQAFQTRANKLDADINPLLAICLRRDELLKEESVYNDNAEKDIAAGYFLINPYVDKAFKQSVSRSLKELCCAIKTDHDWIVHIQDRVAKGLPPLESDSNQAPPGIRRRVVQPAAREETPSPADDAQPRFRGNPELRRQRRRQRLENRRRRLEQQRQQQSGQESAPAQVSPQPPETPPQQQ
jgi:hypothetical protein